MKIYEIISEAVPNAGPQYTAGAAARRAAATAAPVPAAAPPANRYERWKKASELAKQEKAAQIAKKLSKWKTTIGWFGKLFLLMGIADAIYQLEENLFAGEEMYAEGVELKTEDDLRAYRQFYWGEFQTAVLMPVLVNWLRNARYTAWIARIITGAMTLAGGAVTAVTGAGAAVAGASLVAEQVFFTALIAWLSSETASKWLADHMFEELVFFGKVGENTWNLLAKQVTGTDAYQDAEKKKAATPQKDPNAAPTAPGTSAPVNPAPAPANPNAYQYKPGAGSLGTL